MRVRPPWRRGLRGAEAPAPFVVGVGRSGTTLLRLMLDAHPELTIPPETHFLPDLFEALDRGAGAADVVALLRADRHWGDFRLDPAELRERLGRLSTLDGAGTARAFYRLYAERQGKPRWGDKTPRYVDSMRAIASRLPEARFVHLIRDGRDVALSRIRDAQGRAGKTPPIERIAKLWKRRIEGARRQARRLDHYLELRYEDLVAQPEDTLRKVSGLIELDWDEAMLAYHERAADRLSEMDRTLPPEARAVQTRSAEHRMRKHELASRPPQRDRLQAWRAEMAGPDREAFEAVAGDLLVDLGYPVGDPARESTPAGAL